VAFFKSVFESDFQFAGFQVLVFCSTSFLFISKVSGQFGRAAKTGFKVFGLRSVSVGFDWLCCVASALFVVGRVGSQNWLVFL
jgi:hypothetical protein